MEPFWAGGPKKGSDFILLRLGWPRGLLRPLKKGSQNAPPNRASGAPYGAQYGLVTLGSQTGVNVISAHIPLQKGLQKGVQKGLFGTPFWSPSGREPSKRGSI